MRCARDTTAKRKSQVNFRPNRHNQVHLYSSGDFRNSNKTMKRQSEENLNYTENFQVEKNNEPNCIILWHRFKYFSKTTELQLKNREKTWHE